MATVNLVFDYFAKNKVRAELTAAVSSIEVISNLSIADSSRFKYEYSTVADTFSSLINV